MCSECFCIVANHSINPEVLEEKLTRLPRVLFSFCQISSGSISVLKPGKSLGIIIIFLARMSNEICKLLNEQISGFILKRHCYKWINNYQFCLVPIIHEIWNVGKEIVGTVS